MTHVSHLIKEVSLMNFAVFAIGIRRILFLHFVFMYACAKNVSKKIAKNEKAEIIWELVVVLFVKKEFSMKNIFQELTQGNYFIYFQIVGLALDLELFSYLLCFLSSDYWLVSDKTFFCWINFSSIKNFVFQKFDKVRIE